MEWLKMLYEQFGAPYPRISLCVAVIFGAMLFGGAWWLIGKAYEAKQAAHENSAAQKYLSTSERPQQNDSLRLSEGGIEWDFSGFLGGGVYGEYGARVGGFQVSAVNHTGGTLREASGYVESLITGNKFAVFFNINGLPVKGEDTYGIPNNAPFRLYAPFKPGEGQANSWEQLTLTEFVSELAEFEFVFLYDDKKFTRKFTKSETDAATKDWRDILSGDTMPRVIRKEN